MCKAWTDSHYVKVCPNVTFLFSCHGKDPEDDFIPVRSLCKKWVFFLQFWNSIFTIWQWVDNRFNSQTDTCGCVASSLIVKIVINIFQFQTSIFPTVQFSVAVAYSYNGWNLNTSSLRNTFVGRTWIDNPLVKIRCLRSENSLYMDVFCILKSLVTFLCTSTTYYVYNIHSVGSEWSAISQ